MLLENCHPKCRSEKITSKLDVSIKINSLNANPLNTNPLINSLNTNPLNVEQKCDVVQPTKVESKVLKTLKTCYTLAGCFQFLFQSMIEAHDNFAQEGQTEVCRLTEVVACY